MKKTILLIAVLIFLISLPLATAFTIEEGVCIEPDDSNTCYIFGADSAFTEIKVENDCFYFNDSIFCIEPDSNTANVTINSLNSMSFTVEATANVVFTLGGFNVGSEYEVRVDGVKWKKFTTNDNGILSFSYDSWSSHTFDISLFLTTTTSYITTDILPILLATVLLIVLVNLLLVGNLTPESLLTFLVVTIIVIVTITIII